MYEDQPEHSKRRKCYWNEVDLHDLWHILKQENEDWRYNIDDTWRSQAQYLWENRQSHKELILMVRIEEQLQKKLILEVKKLRPEARIPEKKTIGSAGYDLASLKDITLKPEEMII